MKATIVSTDAVVEMKDIRGRPFLARVWEGVTEAGIPFTGYMSIAQVAREQDQSQFERELTEHKQPSAETMRAIELRFIL